eukprot:GFYU01012807.1.p1 GENE.GFYU01012807.1~~GFYU01012807.1.p1  ORF type:complete len:469 (+),score=121.89 GFYU01012807.1:97-1503(+)
MKQVSATTRLSLRTSRVATVCALVYFLSLTLVDYTGATHAVATHTSDDTPHARPQLRTISSSTVQSVSSAVAAPKSDWWSQLWASTCCKYSNEKTLVSDGWFSKTPVDPLTFPQQLHSEFDINAWCFFGQLKGQKDNYSVVILVQKTDPTLYVLNTYQIGGGIASSTSDFDLGGCVDVGVGVSTKKEPWSLAAKCLDGSAVTVEQQSGQYGVAGADYTIGLHSKANKLSIDISVHDVGGMVSQGNGPNSFLLNWLTTEQRHAIEHQYGGSVVDYQRESGDDMKCQGSYYFSQPLLNVTHFTVKKGGEVIDEANSGTIWFDYVAQTYHAEGRELLKKVGWLFFAMSFVEDNHAIFVDSVETSLGVMPIANMFKGSERVHAWNLDQIEITPVADSKWKSPKSGLEYYMEYIIHVRSPDIRMHVRTLRNDQELEALGNFKYEGIGSVAITGSGYDFAGDVFLELTAVDSKI